MGVGMLSRPCRDEEMTGKTKKRAFRAVCTPLERKANFFKLRFNAILHSLLKTQLK
jgi:hypothetical protein